MFNHLAQFLKQLLADTAFSDRLIAGMRPQYRRSPSAANPRSKYREAFQGEKERARRHAAAGFQPVKVTPRPDGDFAYMDVPGGKSRQVLRAERRRHVKMFGY